MYEKYAGCNSSDFIKNRFVTFGFVFCFLLKLKTAHRILRCRGVLRESSDVCAGEGGGGRQGGVSPHFFLGERRLSFAPHHHFSGQLYTMHR